MSALAALWAVMIASGAVFVASGLNEDDSLAYGIAYIFAAFWVATLPVILLYIGLIVLIAKGFNWARITYTVIVIVPSVFFLAITIQDGIGNVLSVLAYTAVAGLIPAALLWGPGSRAYFQRRRAKP